jgi:hypothetical protein
MEWRKSSYSKDWNQALCVEVATVPGNQLIRDSKNPQGHILRIPDANWSAFIAGLRNGDIA